MERTLRKHLPGGVFDGVSPARSRAMAAVRGRGNKTTERGLRLGLVRGGVRGWKLRPKGLRGNPDFLFPEARVAIFVDGCFWHGCPDCGHVPRTNRAFWAAKIERNREPTPVLPGMPVSTRRGLIHLTAAGSGATTVSTRMRSKR